MEGIARQPPAEIPFRYYLLLTRGSPPLSHEETQLKLAKWKARMGGDIWESADDFLQDMAPLRDDWNRLAHRVESLPAAESLKIALSVFSRDPHLPPTPRKKAPPPGKVRVCEMASIV
jgi:hypothetical protein